MIRESSARSRERLGAETVEAFGALVNEGSIGHTASAHRPPRGGKGNWSVVDLELTADQRARLDAAAN